MEKTKFSIGDKIEMTHVRSAVNGALSKRKFGSRILDFDGNRTIKISAPIIGQKVIPLEIGDEYRLCFFTGSGLYECRAVIRKRYIQKRTYMLEAFLITELTKYQRRKFYRLECMFPIKYRQLSETEAELRKRLEQEKFGREEEKKKCLDALHKLPKEWCDGTISDLSGGGVRFHASMQLDQDAMIEVMLPLSMQTGIMPITFIMKVVACTYYEGSRVAYEIRGEFENVTDAERELVVKYVFEEQRRRLRKE